MIGRVLDVSAIVDYVTVRSVYMTALVRVAVDQAIPLAVPAAALTQAWRQIPADARPMIGDLLGRPVAIVGDLDTYAAADVGLLLHTASAGEVVAGHVAWTAVHRGWPAVTADPSPLRAVVPDLPIDPLP